MIVKFEKCDYQTEKVTEVARAQVTKEGTVHWIKTDEDVLAIIERTTWLELGNRRFDQGDVKDWIKWPILLHSTYFWAETELEKDDPRWMHPVSLWGPEDDQEPELEPEQGNTEDVPTAD